jgi:hypothetical protein
VQCSARAPAEIPLFFFLLQVSRCHFFDPNNVQWCIERGATASAWTMHALACIGCPRKEKRTKLFSMDARNEMQEILSGRTYDLPLVVATGLLIGARQVCIYPVMAYPLTDAADDATPPCL